MGFYDEQEQQQQNKTNNKPKRSLYQLPTRTNGCYDK